MEWILLLVTSIFLIIVQTAIPFLMKRTVVFGVTVPIEKTKSKELMRYKKLYTLITFIFSIIILFLFFMWATLTSPTENNLVLLGTMIPFAIIMGSLSLYFYFHAKVTRLKIKDRWFQNRKQVKVSDLAIRTQDEMLSWILFTIPMFITFGLIIFTAINYHQFPNQIPIHWGPDGPDAFTAKSIVSVFLLPLTILIMQGMFLGINEMTKKSGIKLRATSIHTSRMRQLRLRKYSSWLLFTSSVLITMMFTFLQITILHENLAHDFINILLPVIILIVTLGATAFFAIKVGKTDSDLDMEVVDDTKHEKIIEVDEDQFWKGGLIYFNKNDPSIFVEKRFGIGWTLNFARPLGYVIIFGPIVLLLLLTFA
ncbi:DUF1648 domain-containing protein [Sutcliffiella halmapala]|uniref:DUF1648 domain-containing protein n=1 Tax=Sutcliffiella halmapala TaxID=79882 RepID=UPI000994F2EF|nr:DUF5808 domain-containing protein [Sutcliffiella halmapala]